MFARNQKVRFVTPLGVKLQGTVLGEYEVNGKQYVSIKADSEDSMNQYGIEQQFVTAISGTSRRESSLLRYREKLSILEANKPTDNPRAIRKWWSERAKLLEMIALREQQIKENAD